MPRLRSQAPSPPAASKRSNSSATTKTVKQQKTITGPTLPIIENLVAKPNAGRIAALRNGSKQHAPTSSSLSSQEIAADAKAASDAAFELFCIGVFGSRAVADERLSRCPPSLLQKLRRVSDKVAEINDLHKDFVQEADNSQRLESSVLPFTALRSSNFPHLADQLLLSSQVVDSIIDCTPPACSSTSSSNVITASEFEDAAAARNILAAVSMSGKSSVGTAKKKLSKGEKQQPPVSAALSKQAAPLHAAAVRKNSGTIVDYDSIVLAPDQFDELVAARLRQLSSMAPLEPTERIYSATEPNRLTKRSRRQWTEKAMAEDPSLLPRIEQILRAKPPGTGSSAGVAAPPHKNEEAKSAHFGLLAAAAASVSASDAPTASRDLVATSSMMPKHPQSNGGGGGGGSSRKNGAPVAKQFVSNSDSKIAKSKNDKKPNRPTLPATRKRHIAKVAPKSSSSSRSASLHSRITISKKKVDTAATKSKVGNNAISHVRSFSPRRLRKRLR